MESIARVNRLSEVEILAITNRIDQLPAGIGLKDRDKCDPKSAQTDDYFSYSHHVSDWRPNSFFPCGHDWSCNGYVHGSWP